MSLVCWLPLNGDLNNQGLDSSVSALTASSPAYTDGKIGSCIHLNGYATNTTTFNSLKNISVYSFACWLKISTEETESDNYSRIFSINSNNDGNTNGVRIEHIPTAGQFQIIVNKSDTYGSNVTYYRLSVDKTSASDKWAHIAVTNDGTQFKVYLNGALASTNNVSNIYETGYLTGGMYLGHSSGHCYLNDARIYDHCLSPKEVSELAKGLVCNFKLSGIGAENLIPKSRIVNRSLTTFTYDSENNIYDCVAPTGSGTWGYGITFKRDTSDEISVPIGTTICFSLEVKPDIDCSCNSDVNNAVADGSVTGGNDYDDTSVRFYNNKKLTANIWNKIYWTYTAKTYDLYDANSNWGIVTTDLEESVAFQLRNIKVEYGASPTPWIPNKSDDFYSILGLDDNTEYDCSGYGNNGTINGGISWVGDSPRYNGSYSFNGAEYITFSNPLTSSSTDFTISCWAKFDSVSGNDTICTMRTAAGSGIALFRISNNIRFDDNSQTTFSYYTVPANEWLHIAVTRTSSAKKLYINGELKGTVTTVGDMDKIYSTGSIGASSVSGGSLNNYTEGNISDFRIYVTALSDEDIKKLYNTPASIDSHGNLYAYSFEEVE